MRGDTGAQRRGRRMRCTRCRAPAEVELRQHNAGFCRWCFLFFVQRQVERSIEKLHMLRRDEPVLVAVSGGKDSLALWDILVELGYETSGLHLSLGIGSYSDESTARTRRFAERRGLPLEIIRLSDEGITVPEAAAFTHRPPCSACGTMKRHYFDRLAVDRGFPVVATGHNLDDEAARLLGNVLHWQINHLARQHPVLQPTHPRFVRKVKPLYRCSEYEMAIYCFFRRIDYLVDECPNSIGATQLLYKDALNRMEAASPGTKLGFIQEFLRKGSPAFRTTIEAPAGSCASCGSPTNGELCSYCRLLREVEHKRAGRRERAAS